MEDERELRLDESKVDIGGIDKLLSVKDTSLELANEATKKLIKQVIHKIEDGRDEDNMFYQYLKEHLDEVKPNTIGKMLKGCINGKTCPFTNKEPSFYYDINTKKMTRSDYGFEDTNELNEGIVANLYLEENMDILPKTFFKEFQNMGFSKIKVHHRSPRQMEYTTYIIEDIGRYLSEEKDGYMIIALIIFLVGCLFFIHIKSPRI